MANTEVGTAYVTIIPSAKNFARTLQKEIAKQFHGANLDRMIADALGNARVRLPVEPVVDDIDRMDPVDVPVRADRTALDDVRDTTQRLLAGMSATVRAELDAAGLRPELESAVDRADDNVRARVGTDVDTGGLLARLRESVRAASRSVVARVRVEFDRERLDVDVRTAIARIKVEADGGRLGHRIAAAAGDSFRDGITSALSSVIHNPIVSTVGVGLAVGVAAAFAPVAAATIGAAVGAALIGGAGLGLIGVGALILRENPRIVAAFTDLKTELMRTLRGAAEPLIQPFVESLGMLRQLVVDVGPDLRALFETIAPAVRPLTEGFVGFIKGALPGIQELAEAAVPMFKDLASTLPRLGEDVGDFFRLVSESGPGATAFLRDLLNIAGLALITFGQFVSYAGQAYAWFREAIDGTLEILRQSVVGWGYIVEEVIGFFRRLGAFITGIYRSIRTDTDSWVAFFKGIPGRIVRALGGLGDLLRGAGRQLIQGLINGIRAMVPNLSGTLGWITSMIPDWKGPMDTDRRLLQPAGQAIMGGLIRGIHGERRALEAELGSVTSLIAGTPLTTPPAGVGTPAAAVQPAVPTLRFAGDAPGSFMAWVKENIRTDYGGDPVAALGTVSR